MSLGNYIYVTSAEELKNWSEIREVDLSCLVENFDNYMYTASEAAEGDVDLSQPHVQDELSDILFDLTQLARKSGVSMEWLANRAAYRRRHWENKDV